MMRRLQYLTIVGLETVLLACGGGASGQKDDSVNDSVKNQLSGIWLDDNTETPMFVIKGDSIAYITTGKVMNAVKFDLKDDTLIIHGEELVKYVLFKHHEHVLQFQTPVGDILSLHKSESDSLIFEKTQVEQPAQVIKRDSVVNFQGKRYRGYVYINPTKKKVVYQSLSEEGLPIDDVYYDNIIHICVYQGSEKQYAQDISKEMFSDLIPKNFIDNAILSEMEFKGVNARGYHYLAQLCQPEGSTCYYIRLTASFDGKLTMELQQ